MSPWTQSEGIDYFSKGSRPFLLQFPPWIGHLVLPRALHQACALAPGEAAEPAEPELARTSSSFSSCAGQAPAGLGPAVGGSVRAPEALHSAFDPAEVQPWKPGHFDVVEKMQDAVRNKGQVHIMRDATSEKLVAVKCMPNDWVCSCHSDFVSQYPSETEQPWQDIGCNRFLSAVSYPYGCRLLGVYRGEEHTAVVSELATGGDLFSWCGAESGAPPGPEREAMLRPFARQIVRGVQQLHDMSIVHRDLSLENLVISEEGSFDEVGGEQAARIRVIDFGMASTARRFRQAPCGKASYQSPEQHSDEEYDAFLSDAFAVGVSLYAAAVKDYPWLSTTPGGCKCFDYVKKNGFRKYIAKRKLRGTHRTVSTAMSEGLARLLEGLLALDPAERLTLGEAAWEKDGARRSVWDEAWLSSKSCRD